MCGFAGVLNDSDVTDARLRSMACALQHRGPDDQGLWSDPAAGVGLAFARLAIIDLSQAGHQPMRSVSGRFTIAFNGEIYNYQSIRSELEREHKHGGWRGHSDTEVLLAGFETWGIQPTIERTVGMFAFAIWDAKKRVVTLGRDRMGEKPLYYGWQGNSFLFGSELKALREHPAFAGQIDRTALTAFMRHGYVPAPRSIYVGIQKLTPGTLLEVTRDATAPLTPAPYWSLLDAVRRGLAQPFTGSDGDAIRELEARLGEAVSIQQIADVPLGAFLSGGIDSSTIVALMQSQSRRPVSTFTIGFEDARYDEAVHAKAVAAHLGTEHHELYVTEAEARSVIPRLPSLYDEPFADSSQIPTFLVSQLARRSVTVTLSGDAGDELFGGYNRYVWGRRLLRYPAPLRRIAATALRTWSPARWDSVYQTLWPLVPRSFRVRMPGDKAHKLASVLAMESDAAIYQRLVSIWPDPASVVLGGSDATQLEQSWDALADLGSAVNRMMALDALTYLPDDILCKIDRAPMGVSLESRVPFLDHRVVEFSWRLPLSMKMRDGQGKWILRQLLDKYVPRTLIDRPKMGFGVPIEAWLRGPLREWAEELLSEPRLREEGFLNATAVRQRWTEHLSGRRNWHEQLWNVLMFQAWLEAERIPAH